MERKILLVSILMCSTNLMASMASVKVIYGQDDRLDLIHVLNPKYSQLAKSTAAMVPNTQIKEHNNMQIKLGGRTLADTGVCETERFAQQPTAANCSGFLVAKDVLVTAGHCVRSQVDCSNSSWVFDYKVEYSLQSEVIVDKSNVYKCESIISRSLDSSTKNDYAVLKLKTEVIDRDPLKVRKSGKPNKGDGLVVIGHPSGLPTKVAAGSTVRAVNDVFLVADLDTYGGNSGSAVFNGVTGEVEGILVRGDTDYVWDSTQGCRVSNVIGQSAGRGEDVTLITIVEGIPEQVEPEPTPEPTPDPVETVPDEEEENDEPSQDVPSWWLMFLAWLNAGNGY